MTAYSLTGFYNVEEFATPGVEKSAERGEAVILRAVRGDRPVLLRVLRADELTSQDRTRLRYDVEVRKGIDTPAVLEAIGIEPHGPRTVLVMEDFGGRPLTSIFAEGELPLEDALEISIGIARALGELHVRRIIHKNIDPSSIYVNRRTGEVKLSNFSLASRLGRENPRALSAKELGSKAAYLSPEMTGRMNRDVDYRTDLYSLGVVLYEMFSDRLPYEGDPMALVHGHIALVPPAPHTVRATLPRAVSDVVMKLLAKNAEERYQSTYGVVADLREQLDALREGRTTEDFEPGKHDLAGRFQLPQKLYGRDAERASLLESFQRAAEGSTTLMLIAGHSGIGKSSLVNELHKPVVERRGYYSAGKYQQINQRPYSGLIEALRGVFRQILGESEDQVAHWRERFLAAFGPNGRVLVDVIPELELIVGPQPAVPPLGPTESQNRFRLVFGGLIDALARFDHPVALFLDDLQNADVASIELIRFLVESMGSRHLLLVGAYRDNEVSAAHPLTAAVDALRAGGAQIEPVTLRPLGATEVERFVADALADDPEVVAVRELAALVSQRTEGNPFLMGQLLSSLNDHGLVAFDTEAGRWHWDVERIRAAPVSDNVGRLVAEKIGTLPPATQRALQLATCFGNVFDLHELAELTGALPFETNAHLWEAVEQGLIRPIDDAYKYVGGDLATVEDRCVEYEFLHDRVVEATASLLSEDERLETHLRIGRMLQASTPADERESRVFDSVNHLDLAIERVVDPAERRELAQLNLTAGQRALAANAHAAAIDYLDHGIGLLPPDPWEDAYEVAFPLLLRRAECSFVLARLEDLSTGLDELSRRARSREDRDEVHALKAVVHLSRGRFNDVVDETRAAIRLYGVEIPPDEKLPEAAGAEIGALFGLLAQCPLPSVLEMPEGTDPEHAARLRLFSHIILLVGPTRIDLLAWVVPASIRETLTHGPTAGSASAFAAFGTMAASKGDFESARAFGDIAMALTERYDDRSSRALNLNIYAGFVRPWLVPTAVCLPFLERAYGEALESGMLNYAGFITISRNALGITAGEPLDQILERVLSRVDFFMRRHENEAALGISIHARSLMLFRDGRLPTEPEWYDEGYILGQTTSPMVTVSVFSDSMQHAYLDGDLPRALDYMGRVLPMLPVLGPLVESARFRFFRALVYAAALPTASSDDQPKWREVIADDRAHAEALAEVCPENFLHRARLLAAEEARLDGDVHRATDLYDDAIQAATAGKIVQERALANELAARFQLARGKSTLARAYLMEARDVWEQWGARARVAWLEEHHAELLPPRVAPVRTETSSLDALTVTKASQAISGEIVLENLLRRLMTTMLENAGAQRGVLLLKGDHPLVVEAEAGEPVPVMRPGGVKDQVGAAATILRYVERLGDTLVLSDASRAGAFSRDPEVVEAGLRSVLCMPIRRRSVTVGILYLENRLVAGAFTPERCHILDLLTAQSAISLENARLYDTMENRVRDRTRELRLKNAELSQALDRLRETQKQLVLQEKLASLGALTSGIAHEIRNPLNFVTNFASHAIEMTGELREELAEVDQLPEERREVVQECLDEIGFSVGKVVEHGKRANNIVSAMLEHARPGSAERVDVDLNELVSEYARLAVEGMRTRPDGAEVTLSFELGSLPPVHVVRSEIGRVVLNLVNNGADAACLRAKGGGAPAEVKVSTRELGGGRIEVRFRDNGAGVPASIRDEIFNPFFTTKSEGTGLGLSISHDVVVQGHAGTLTLETEEGRYTEMIMRLPLR